MPYRKSSIGLLGQALRRILGLRQRFVSGLVIGFWVVLVMGAVAQVSEAQTSVTRGTITEVLDGNQVFIQNRQARVNDVANRGQQVRTGRARAQVNFNTGAVARLSSNSVLTVGQCAQLQRGVLLVNGAVNGCTSSVTAGVRGTTYILEVDDDGREEIKVLEGEVVVTKNDIGAIEPSLWIERRLPPRLRAKQFSIPRVPGVGIPSTRPSPSPSPSPSPAPAIESADPENRVVLSAGQKVATRRGSPLGPVEDLTLEEINAILSGSLFNGYLQSLPGYAAIQSTLQRIYPGLSLPGVPRLPVPGVRIPFF
ncbi:FecR domain-containing protein [Thermoleptolyngbya sp. C42_A2020_037]|uniref:FecR domain-containing protein n=1 Tax=Thermoleptolyngbya sp. C42_A2020_037 TaxID=2747799 RepID=UPI001A099B26|nr:FecR domain-containing protein [Thermoleptolyngbya sp. C42_A2020_037]MBF2083482.1 FecR domain-containing protein [Thermoleptolyngbya sp. C42_A2020_037]